MVANTKTPYQIAGVEALVGDLHCDAGTRGIIFDDSVRLPIVSCALSWELHESSLVCARMLCQETLNLNLHDILTNSCLRCLQTRGGKIKIGVK